VHRAGRCFVGELRDGMRYPAPDSLTLAIAGICKCIIASRTLRPGFLAVTLEQKVRRTPDLKLRYHAPKIGRKRSTRRKSQIV
jgi:hypothetical protein